MKKNGFQARLLITYSVFVSVLIISFSSVYFILKVSETSKAVSRALVLRADRMGDQFDTVLATMDFASTDILSLPEFIPSLTTLAYFDRKNSRYQKDIVEALKYVEKSIYRYSLMRDFYRVSVYTESYDIYSNNFNSVPDRKAVIDWIDNNKYLEDCRKLAGRMMIMPEFHDPWNSMNEISVMGIIRAVVDFQKGSIVGFIEIQSPYEIVEQIFSTPEYMEIHVKAVTAEGYVLYDSNSELKDPTEEKTNRLFFREPYRYTTSSEYSGITIEISQDRWKGLSPTVKTIWIFFTITMLVLFISLAGIRYFTVQLTRPIRNLREHIDKIELGSLPSSANLSNVHNEIEALDYALTLLHNRLNDAVNREIASQSLQLQANLDALQAQVNPHFLYNLLNVISSMGLESGNEEICDVSDRIATLLRYSTSTGERDTTIRKEVSHVMNYLSLMKERYEHKLMYSSDIDDALLDVKIPKMILQPLIENSIKHNFKMGQAGVNISINGCLENNGKWKLTIIDDGNGIKEKELSQIRFRFSEIRDALNAPSSNVELNLGGLGLINTYARLFLYFHDEFTFSLENKEGGGLEICIGGSI